jgi:hypothetical protein
MVYDTHLFILQLHTSIFGAGWRGEMVPLFLVWQCREAFHQIGVQDVAEFDSD